MNKRVIALILAAGSSSRLGHPKQLLPWKNKTLLGHTIAIAHESKAAGVRVVLGSQAQSIRAALSDTTTEFLINNNWEEGMGGSISCGVDHLLAEKKVADGILIMLCDQPLIDSNFLNVLIDAYTENEYGIVGTLYGKHIGVPVIFDRSYFPKLSGLKGEGGARSILRENSLDSLGFAAPANNPDIDTAADYRKLLKGLDSST